MVLVCGAGLEPATSALWGRRSNQLSYPHLQESGADGGIKRPGLHSDFVTIGSLAADPGRELITAAKQSGQFPAVTLTCQYPGRSDGAPCWSSPSYDSPGSGTT